VIKTYEALIATAMLIGTLALISSPYFIPEEKYSNLREAGEDAMLTFVEEDGFRRLAVVTDDETSLQNLKDYVDTHIVYPYSLRVCDMNENCVGSIPSEQSYTVVSYLVDGNLSIHSMKKVQIFLWLFKVNE